jgi:hypothetical protein
MSRKLTVQEMAIVIAVPTQNPTLINEDFLKYSGIVPSDWQLARQPVYNQQVAQIVFENGTSIAAQADRVMFLQAIGDRPLSEIAIADVARRYVETLKKADYRAVGLNFRSYFSYGTDTDAPREFINKQILSSGDWQNFGSQPMRASVTLNYTLEDNRTLNVTVNDATIQFPEKDTEAITLFAANFSEDLSELPAESRLKAIASATDRWEDDLLTLSKLLEKNFGSKDTTPTTSVPLAPDAGTVLNVS